MSQIRRRTFLSTSLAAAGVAAGPWVLRAHAQDSTIKIGILYDHSGPFSAAGSLNCWRGAKMMIDYVDERGGVIGKHKAVQVDGDSQSKTEVAINEAERLVCPLSLYHYSIILARVHGFKSPIPMRNTAPCCQG